MRGHDKTDATGRRDADHDGVPDNRDPVVRTAPGADPGITREVRRDAYERGRSDERSRHKRNPLLSILIAIAAVFGIAVFALYIYNGGSFTETGRDLDTVVGRAGEEAQEASREVADETGEALQDGGRQLEQVGEAGSGDAARRSTAPSTPPAQ